MFDNLHLTNMLRSEVEHIPETGFPLDVFPDKIQDVILNLAQYENFNVEYTASIVLSAAATASGNSCRQFLPNPHQGRMENKSFPLYDANRSSRIGKDSAFGIHIQANQRAG